MQDFEKLGMFYLGKMVNPENRELEDPLLYESKDLTTHAVCVGMTGSGKTGLGITLLEEAALDKIPAIIIDPKGDLGNLLLTFPNLTPEEFKPWVDSASAERKGMNSEEYAQYLATTWKEGLDAWGEDAARIKKLKESAECVIYTPASQAGIPISILSSFAAPSKEELLDWTAVRDKTLSITSSLLGLLGIDANPLKSREFILISTIIGQAWEKGEDLDITALIGQVQKPPFSKVGALNIDTFYPPKERMALSISLNNLLASPGFQAWMEGGPLDIQQLLYTDTGKPKLSILSISHLSDPERMFFVTLLLNEVLSWMRRQPGTSSLRALLYMDEIFGFFPPTAMPPSKLPMLTLLKQARAYGVGIVLATQNPVDLDYKGLANCGTWFIGKLQTERDKARVLEGLKVASNGEVDANTLDQMIALTGKRTFIMRSIHEKDPILFQTRWTLSYLYGPLTLAQIASLTDKTEKAISERNTPSVKATKKTKGSTKPHVPPGINELFIHLSRSGQPVHYEPRVMAIAKVHFVNAKNNIDLWQDVCVVAKSDETGRGVHWEEGKKSADLKNQIQKQPLKDSTFADLPAGLMQEKNYALFAKKFAESLYQTETLTIYQTTHPKILSKAGESEKDFRIRVALEIREKRDDLIKKIREKYAGKITTLSDKVRRAQEKLTQKSTEAGLQKAETLIAFGSTLMGALFGRKLTKGTISQTGTTLRRATRMSKDSRDATQIQKEVGLYQQQLQELEAQMNSEISSMITSGDMGSLAIETTATGPRKSDISVESVSLVWCDW